MFKFIAVQLHRSDITQKNFSTLDIFMKKIEKRPKDFFQKLIFHVGGYDFVPDELYEIEEVRWYIQQVFQRYPHLLYFVNPANESWKWLILCLSDEMQIYYEGDYIDEEAIRRMIQDHADLPQKEIIFQLSPSERKRIGQAIRQFAKKHRDGANGDFIERQFQQFFQQTN